ncbi:MAG: hypothetical protein AB8A37_00030 [Prochlorococcus sp.]
MPSDRSIGANPDPSVAKPNLALHLKRGPLRFDEGFLTGVEREGDTPHTSLSLWTLLDEGVFFFLSTRAAHIKSISFV